MESAATLQSVQVALHDYLLGRPSAIPGALREGAGIPIAQRLGIYHHAYRARLLEAMRDSFEKTWAYLGDDRFAAAAAAFIESHPPRHGNLRWYGGEFGAWLAMRYPADLDISEVALIDWGLRNAFDGVDATPVTMSALDRLSATDWQQLGCRFAPTLRTECVRFNAAAIWHALDSDVEPPAATALEEPRWLMIWRKQWQPHFRTIGTVEQTLLSKLRNGQSIAAACAEAVVELGDEHIASSAGTLLRGWVEEEMICELTGIA